MPDETSHDSNDGALAALSGRHVRAGWAMLAVYLTLGAFLEALHGFKVGWYLNVSNETRRLMLTLAHAHGDLVGAVNILYAFTLARERAAARWQTVASALLLAGSLLLPLGFLFGGLVVYGGDPGVGVLLVPPGAALLIAAVGLIAWKTGGRSSAPAEAPEIAPPPTDDPPRRKRPQKRT
ncbi:MAG: hypothetical protein HY049_10150 [Acidobacteria bacterium]|nr:hypothetical protein [Acidobacteriota bacterium]